MLTDSEEASLCASAAGGMCDSLEEQGGGESGGGCGEDAAQFLHSWEPAGEAAGPVPAFGWRGQPEGPFSYHRVAKWNCYLKSKAEQRRESPLSVYV